MLIWQQWFLEKQPTQESHNLNYIVIRLVAFYFPIFEISFTMFTNQDPEETRDDTYKKYTHRVTHKTLSFGTCGSEGLYGKTLEFQSHSACFYVFVRVLRNDLKEMKNKRYTKITILYITLVEAVLQPVRNCAQGLCQANCWPVKRRVYTMTHLQL